MKTNETKKTQKQNKEMETEKLKQYDTEKHEHDTIEKNRWKNR